MLKRLGATALPRAVLLGGKTLAVLLLEVVQVVLVCGVGLRAGAGTRTATRCSARRCCRRSARSRSAGSGCCVAGTLRAEVTLAAANLVWLVLLFAGGIAIPLSKYPARRRDVLQYLPSAALSDGLHRVLQDGAGVPLRRRAHAARLGRGRVPAAARWFRWE